MSLLSPYVDCRRVVVVRVVCTVGLLVDGLRSGHYSLRLADITLSGWPPIEMQCNY